MIVFKITLPGDYSTGTKFMAFTSDQGSFCFRPRGTRFYGRPSFSLSPPRPALPPLLPWSPLQSCKVRRGSTALLRDESRASASALANRKSPARAGWFLAGSRCGAHTHTLLCGLVPGERGVRGGKGALTRVAGRRSALFPGGDTRTAPANSPDKAPARKAFAHLRSP